MQVQKIITSTSSATQPLQGNIITSTNLQQLLQRSNIPPGQKIVVQSGPGGVQKLLLASSPQQQAQGSGEKRIIVHNAAGQPQQYIIQNQNTSQPQQQILTIGGQKILMQTSPQVQTIKTVNSIPQQQIQLQFQQESPSQQPQQQQIIIQNSNNLSNQVGKVQVMNFNGQQVLVKSVGNNQSVIVGQVKSSTPQQLPVKSTAIITTAGSQPVIKTVQMNSQNELNEQAVLADHPPGTVLKCVTAQVMQTANGPRIVLHGLQGSDITPQQSQVLQQQVKQQLMKGELEKV